MLEMLPKNNENSNLIPLSEISEEAQTEVEKLQKEYFDMAENLPTASGIRQLAEQGDIQTARRYLGKARDLFIRARKADTDHELSRWNSNSRFLAQMCTHDNQKFEAGIAVVSEDLYAEPPQTDLKGHRAMYEISRSIFLMGAFMVSEERMYNQPVIARNKSVAEAIKQTSSRWQYGTSESHVEGPMFHPDVIFASTQFYPNGPDKYLAQNPQDPQLEQLVMNLILGKDYCEITNNGTQIDRSIVHRLPQDYTDHAKRENKGFGLQMVYRLATITGREFFVETSDKNGAYGFDFMNNQFFEPRAPHKPDTTTFAYR